MNDDEVTRPLPTAADDAEHETAVMETTMDTDSTPRDTPQDHDEPILTGADGPGTQAGPATDSRPSAADERPVAAAPYTAPLDPPRRGVRVGTVVWGLVIAAIGVGLLAAASGVSFDVELAVIGLVAAAGLALLIGSVATSARRSR